MKKIPASLFMLVGLVVVGVVGIWYLQKYGEVAVDKNEIVLPIVTFEGGEENAGISPSPPPAPEIPPTTMPEPIDAEVETSPMPFADEPISLQLFFNNAPPLTITIPITQSSAQLYTQLALTPVGKDQLRVVAETGHGQMATQTILLPLAYDVAQMRAVAYVGLANTPIIVIGEVEKMPAITYATESAPIRYHLILAGESLVTIGEKYSVDWLVIAEANKMQPPYHIKAGEVLQIPSLTR